MNDGKTKKGYHFNLFIDFALPGMNCISFYFTAIPLCNTTCAIYILDISCDSAIVNMFVSLTGVVSKTEVGSLSPLESGLNSHLVV